MRPVVRNLFAAVVLLATPLVSKADAFTESVQFGPGSTDYDNSVGVTSGPGGTSLYLFDTNGGTLNSITFLSSYGITATITLTNTSASSSNGTARTQSGAQFSSNNSAVTSALNNAVNNYVDPIDGNVVTFGNSELTPIAYDLRGTVNSYSLGPGASKFYNSNGNSSRGPVTDTNAVDLSAFSRAGGGTFTPLFSTATGLSVANRGGNTTGSQVTAATGTLQITYNFTPNATPPVAATPEPSSLLLLGTGVVGLAGAGRRRFRRS